MKLLWMGVKAALKPCLACSGRANDVPIDQLQIGGFSSGRGDVAEASQTYRQQGRSSVHSNHCNMIFSLQISLSAYKTHFPALAPELGTGGLLQSSFCSTLEINNPFSEFWV